MKTGGGILGKNVRHSKSGKAEPKPHAVNKNWVAQVGLSRGDHVTGQGKPLQDPRADPYKGRGYSGPVGPTSNMGQGPGANRTIYRSGSQQGLKPARPMPEGRDILRDFGPDSKR
jgi:hypothetical protein